MSGRAAPRRFPARKARLAGITRPVVVLGLVSLLADLSSEMVYPLIPLFVTGTLGAPALALGVVEGVAEGTANLTKMLSGRWADRAGSRKPFVVGGYALAALGKGVLALAPGWPVALGGRAFDRFGKGLRTAPRDAMLADFAEPRYRGRVFGFHRAMDTLGAVAGPLVALALIALLEDRLRLVIAIAVVPGVAAVVALRWLPERQADRAADARDGRRWSELPGRYYLLLGITVLFMLGNSSDAFLILRAENLGLTTAMVVLAYVAYNAVYAALSLPAGVISDRIPRAWLLVAGWAAFAAVYAGFALAGDGAAVWPLFVAYGAYMAMTEGVSKALVADMAPGPLRASAMGLFQGVAGLAALLSSVAAGLLWDQVGPSAPFYLGAACALAAAVALGVFVHAGAIHPPSAATQAGG
ncbi:MAG: MFS transporter [Dehalococcoidia bacterium]|nr:MAG: MFS transporter [bacterium]MCE7927509.1 MFS transporter [Chloroflexi bacterium CFX7]MCK6565018.1 MFS transporter [Dehalococcoidia bacterium]MCL4231128.1 MFS transporter [Dehalococcoidia bacterium]NUQ55237.1 MFS transporter [Dehalococcoidia bacterium]